MASTLPNKRHPLQGKSNRKRQKRVESAVESIHTAKPTSALYANLRYTTLKHLENLARNDSPSNHKSTYKSVEILHGMSRNDGKETCLTRKLTATIRNELFYPEIQSRRTLRNQRWTTVTAAEIQIVTEIKKSGFSSAYEAECAGLVYRFCVDEQFQRAVIIHVNNLQKDEQAEKLGALVKDRRVLVKAMEILDNAAADVNDLVDKPEGAVCSTEEIKQTRVKRDTVKRYCELKIGQVDAEITACKEKKIAERGRTTQSFVQQIYDEIHKKTKEKNKENHRSIVSIRGYIEQFFEIDAETNTRRLLFRRDFRGREANATLVTHAFVQTRLKAWIKANVTS